MADPVVTTAVAAASAIPTLVSKLDAFATKLITSESSTLTKIELYLSAHPYVLAGASAVLGGLFGYFV